MSNVLLSTQNGLRFAFNRKSEGMHGLLKTDNGGLVKVIKDSNNKLEDDVQLRVNTEKLPSSIEVKKTESVEQDEKKTDGDVWSVENEIGQKLKRGRKPKLEA